MRTELIADQPTVLLIHQDEGFVDVLKKALESKSVRVKTIRSMDIAGSGDDLAALFESCYKICWLTTPEWYVATSEPVRQQVVVFLERFQEKTTLLVPLLSNYAEEFQGEVPFISSFLVKQKQFLVWLNRYLSGAQWIFTQDAIAPITQLQTSIASFISQDIQAGKVYALEAEWYPFSLHEGMERIVTYFLKPSRGSFVIRGQMRRGKELAELIKRRYQSIYFEPISLQNVSGATNTPIPFSTTENIVTESFDSALHEFVDTFPSPHKSIFRFSWQSALQQDSSPPPSRQGAKHRAQAEPSGSVGTQGAPSVVAAVSDAPTQSVETRENTTHSVVSLEEESASNTQNHNSPASGSNQEKGPQKSTEDRDTEVANAFNLNQEVVRLFATSHIQTKRARTQVATKERTKIIKKTKKRTALFYGGLTFTGMGLGILFLIVVFMTSSSLFGREVRQNAELLLTNTQQQSAEAPAFGPLRRLVSVQADAYGSVLSLPAIENAQGMIELAQTIEEAHDSLERTRQMTQNLVASVIQSENTQLAATTPNLVAESLQAHKNIQSLLELLMLSGLWGEDDEDVQKIAHLQSVLKNILQEREKSLVILQQLAPVLPDVLAGNGQRTYALVFQNNQEIRPTGGFIEAVALITLSQDGLVGYRVLNSYQVDQNLPGVVEAPTAIKRFFGDEQFLFHDSNWNPHFPESAEQITWFLEKSQNQEIDGVLTVDVAGLARFLEYLGPLDLPEYSEVVTHRTLSERIEFNSEVILVDETDKKDYRQLVFERVLEKIQQTPADKSPLILGALQKNFETQSMLFAPKRAAEQQAFVSLGWTGGILNPQCPSQLSRSDCQMEAVAQFEANVGVNKANYHLERSVEHVVSMQPQSVQHERVITYTNTAQTNSWPRGTYRSYVRLYVPKTAVLDSIQVGEQQVAAVDIDVTQEQERQVLGFYIEVPIRSTVPVIIRFSTPLQAEGKDRFAYAFFEQQQPGLENTNYRFRMTPPSAFSPTLIAPQPDIRGDDLVFVKENQGHAIFGMQLQRH